MSRTTDSIIPSIFLTVLRSVVPQFNELQRSKIGPAMAYAQQGNDIQSLLRSPLISGLDAEECWTHLTNALKDVPGIDPSGATVAGKKFVDQFLTGEIRREYVPCDLCHARIH